MASPKNGRDTTGVLGDLPDAVRTLIPELARLPATGEPRADCSACVMCTPALPAGHRWAFAADARCCTYHPKIPNYLIGRILAREDSGSARMRARLTDRSGVTAWGVKPSEAYRRLDRRAGTGFGTNVALQCPFWLGGATACSIWPDRTAVCRTWFCRYEDGALSQQRWVAVKQLLETLELRLGAECVADGEPPAAGASANAWEEWFLWCAAYVDQLGGEALEDIAYPPFERSRTQLAELLERTRSPVPDVIVPVLSDSLVFADHVYVRGHARHDFLALPPDVIHFFAALNGRRRWREAIDVAAAESAITEDLVRELHRIGAVQSPPDEARASVQGPVPEVLSPAMNKPIALGEDVWLQGFERHESIVAPRSVFEFLALLDGDVGWPDALHIARRHGAEVDETLVENLYRIGALVSQS